MLRQSYCGLCDDCQLGNREFLETVSRLKGLVETFRANYWTHCFPQEKGFSFEEFRKGLDWFLAHPECPGCKGGRGSEDCPIRLCAEGRHLEFCWQCPDLSPCDKFDFLLAEFPDVKSNLRRRQVKYKAQMHHRRLEPESK
ncbi:MAG: hypothetical protein A2Y80_06335 [Deltaproteobacteria bacterium RBG_13_58_19]|nr:MAG: hypothetical protein A2Y80_06335 [Deltaproteobacteria bacterium RBG_13_58_19]